MYRFHIKISHGVLERILFSIYCMVNSEVTTDIGEPIVTPCFYLSNLELYWNMEESRHNLVNSNTSSLLSDVYSCRVSTFSSMASSTDDIARS